MRAAEDFAAYVAARWAPVVRSLVLLGLPLDLAVEVAARSLADLRAEWTDLRAGGDRDVELFRRVLDRRAEALRGGAAPEPPEARSLARGRLDTPAFVVRVEALEVVLRRWPGPPASRLSAVLRHVAGLDEIQVAEVVGRPVADVVAHLRVAAGTVPGGEPAETLGLAADVVEPGPPAVQRIRQISARERRRSRTRWGAAALVLLVAVAAWQWAAQPSKPVQPGDRLPRATATDNDGSVDLTWWADGVLHLPRVDLAIADLSQVIAAGPEAVYRTGEGAVVHVTDDGRRTYLGRTGGPSPLVGTSDGSLVAWIEVEDPRSAQIVVYDVRRAREVARRPTRPLARVITFDADRLYYGQGGHDYAWRYPNGEPTLADSRQRSLGRFGVDLVPALVDVAGDVRIEQAGPTLDLVRPDGRRLATVPGFGGRLSPDGQVVLTGPERGREPRLYYTATGHRVPVGLPIDWQVREGALTSDDRVVWVVDTGPEPDGGLALVVCRMTRGVGPGGHLVAAPCGEPFELGDLGDRMPVLAREGTR